MLFGVTLAMTLLVPMVRAQAQSAEQKPAEQKAVPQIYQTFYLTQATQQQEVNDIQTDLRNMLPRAAIYSAMSQNAISIRGSEEDMARAQKILSELDRPRKVYRLTYTITDTDGGKKMSPQHFSLIVVAGTKATLKQGSRVPIVTGTYDAGTAKKDTEVQYVDVGLSIDASLDGERLHSKVEQSSLAEEKVLTGTQDPVVRQTVLDGLSNVAEGKPTVLGSFDFPGGTRHEEIEVAAELVL